MPMTVRFSSWVCGDRQCCQPCMTTDAVIYDAVNGTDAVIYDSFPCFFSPPGVVGSHTLLIVLPLKGDPLQISKRPFCSSLSCSLLCLWTPAASAPSNPQFPLLNSGRPQALSGLPLPVPGPGNSLQAVSWSNHGAHTVCFPSLRDYSLELFDVQCLKSVDCIYFVQAFNCFRQDGKSSSCFSILARGKSSSSIC